MIDHLSSIETLQHSFARMSCHASPLDYAIHKLEEMLDDPEVAKIPWKTNMIQRHINQLKYVRELESASHSDGREGV